MTYSTLYLLIIVMLEKLPVVHVLTGHLEAVLEDGEEVGVGV